VLRYTFGTIIWRSEEIKKIERKTRKMLTMHKMHHPKADTDRLYVKGKEGRGLVQIEAAYKAEIINIAEYLNTNYKEDQFVYNVKSHESIQPNMNSINKTAAQITEKLNQPNEKSGAKQDGIQHTEARLGEFLKKNRQLMREKDTFRWLSKRNLKQKMKEK
jgi:hypothetical protein